MKKRTKGGDVCRPLLIFNHYSKTFNYEKINDGPGSGLDTANLRELFNW